MKKLLILLSVAFASIALTSCNKAEEDNGVTGTKWEAKAGDVTLVLHFVSDTTCTIASGRQGMYGANLEQYLYKPYYGVDGVGLYKKFDDTTITSYIANRVDQSTLKLSGVDSNGLIDYADIVFKKKN